jgi:hypothetical protein
MAGKMPQSMLVRRCHISSLIAVGYTDYQIEKMTGHCHKLAKQIRMQIENNQNVFKLKSPIGAPRKQSKELTDEIESITLNTRRLSNADVASITQRIPGLISVSASTVSIIRHNLGFRFLPPVHTFLLTDLQKLNRKTFAEYHLTVGTDWKNVIFTDESYFWLGDDNRALYRRRGERGPDIEWRTPKFQKKCLFGEEFPMNIKQSS